MNILHDKIVVFKNNINSNEWIDLVHRVDEESYLLEKVERRPHLTMVMPMVFAEKDRNSSIKLKSMFYALAMPQILEYMNFYNNFGIISKKNFIVVSKLLNGNSMEYHNDSNDPKHIIAMLYLNNNYEGGEIMFRDIEIKYKPSPGDFIIYPGSLSHGVAQINGNPRYSIGIGLLDPSYIDKPITTI